MSRRVFWQSPITSFVSIRESWWFSQRLREGEISDRASGGAPRAAKRNKPIFRAISYRLWSIVYTSVTKCLCHVREDGKRQLKTGSGIKVSRWKTLRTEVHYVRYTYTLLCGWLSRLVGCHLLSNIYRFVHLQRITTSAMAHFLRMQCA